MEDQKFWSQIQTRNSLASNRFWTHFKDSSPYYDRNLKPDVEDCKSFSKFSTQRCITPSAHISFAINSTFPNKNRKWMVPSIPVKKSVAKSSLANQEDENPWTILEVNNAWIRKIIEKIRLSNRKANFVNNKKFHEQYKPDKRVKTSNDRSSTSLFHRSRLQVKIGDKNILGI